MEVHLPIPEEHEQILRACIGAAISVHRNLGPGFREIIYKRAYCLELDSRSLPFECEKAVLVRYKEWLIPGQRLDLVVAGVVLIEVKGSSEVARIAQKAGAVVLEINRAAFGTAVELQREADA